MVLVFALMLLAALGKPLILLLLGTKWGEAVIFLQIYSFAMMTDHVTKLNLNLLKVKGRSDLLLRLEIYKKIISFIILFASLPYGVVAICLSKVIYSQIATYINTYYTGKLFGLTYWAQLKDYGPYFLYSILACLPTYLFTGCNQLGNIYILIIGCLVSISLYFMVLNLRKDKVYIEFVQPLICKILKHI